MDLDEETRNDLMDGFRDLSNDVEGYLTSLVEEDEQESLNALFRDVHSIKGNAAMCGLAVLVDYTHALEEVAESLRSGRYPMTALLGETIQLGMDRLRDLHYREICGQHFEELFEHELAELFLLLSDAESDAVDTVCGRVLECLGVEYTLAPADSASECEPSSGVVEASELSPAAAPQVTNTRDLDFFHELALQIDNQNHYWQGRSIQSFDWAHKINVLGGNIVDYEQFSAAIYLHDIGMSFINTEVLQKKGALTPEELAEIRMHPHWGHSYLIRIPGWEDAARMVLEHHEHVNGNGYPNQLVGDQIHPGAKILAIVDAFFSMSSGRADRSMRHSTVRAVSELNARADTQFDKFWLQCFNEMIKQEVREGHL